MNELLVFGIAGTGMWAMRASCIVLARGRALPAAGTVALQHAKHAVLAALVSSSLWSASQGSAIADSSPAVAAALVAGTVAWGTGGLLRTVAAGVGTVAVVSALLG